MQMEIDEELRGPVRSSQHTPRRSNRGGGRNRARRREASTSSSDHSSASVSGGSGGGARHVTAAATRASSGGGGLRGAASALRDPHFPHLLMGYLQLTFNLIVVIYVSYLGYRFVESVHWDVERKVEEYSLEIVGEMAVCARHYRENRCDPSTRVPAVDKACRGWETCMNRDPSVVSRTRVSAETLAGIINSFVEPISYKTMVFFTVALGSFMIISNLAFHFARRGNYAGDGGGGRGGGGVGGVGGGGGGGVHSPLPAAAAYSNHGGAPGWNHHPHPHGVMMMPAHQSPRPSSSRRRAY
jgi:hypothetical protein